MKRQIIIVLGIVLILSVAWATFAQPQGGGFGRMREAQTQALAALQEQLGKLKALMEQAPGTQGRSFQDMSDEERTKMREEFTKRREEQQKIMASMQQEMDRLKGGRQLVTEHTESLAPLKDLLASAQKENAKETAKKIEDMIAQRDKQFQEKMAAMGYSPDMIDRMMQGGPGGRQQ
jgi:septal ring factor EnvC (AmiA/AmiB activator)